MRSNSEKKSITKSVKISPNQLAIIEQRAKEKNMNFSEYMVHCAVHGNDGVAPNIAVKVQELVNIIENIANDLDGNEYVRREELRQKANNLSELFGSTSPQEKLERLENHMGAFMEGGQAIWEYLK